MDLQGLIQEPTLKTKGVKKTKTFDISNLPFVGVLCGVIPLAIFGTINSRWLNISRKRIFIFLGICAALEIVYIVASFNVKGNEQLMSTVFCIYRSISGVIGFAYFFSLKKRFYLHAFLNSKVKWMWQYIILAIILGNALDFMFY